MNQPFEDWPRLSSYVISARQDAGFSTLRSFANAIGVTERTLGKLEAGERVSRETLAAVARGVGWTPDSPRRILLAKEPLPAIPPPSGSFAADSSSDAAAVLFPDNDAKRWIWRIPGLTDEQKLRLIRALDEDSPDPERRERTG